MDSAQLLSESKLFRIILTQRWRQLSQFLNTKVGQTQARELNMFGASALTAALASRPPLRIIKKLLQIDPSASLRPDHHGMIPIQTACRYGTSHDIIKTLVDHDFGSTARAVCSYSHKTPLHYLIKCICDPLEETHRVASIKTKLHFGISDERHDDIATTCSALSDKEFEDIFLSIQYLLEVSPDAIFATHKNTKSPLNILQEFIHEVPEGFVKKRATRVLSRMLIVATSDCIKEESTTLSCHSDASDPACSSKSKKKQKIFF